MEPDMSLDEDSRHLLAILTPHDSPPMHEVDIHVLREAKESRFPDREREADNKVDDREVVTNQGNVPVFICPARRACCRYWFIFMEVAGFWVVETGCHLPPLQ